MSRAPAAASAPHEREHREHRAVERESGSHSGQSMQRGADQHRVQVRLLAEVEACRRGEREDDRGRARGARGEPPGAEERRQWGVRIEQPLDPTAREITGPYYRE